MNLTETHGDTALHKAAPRWHVHITEHLLQNGADITRTNHTGHTAFTATCRTAPTRSLDTDATIRVLLAHGTVVTSETAHRELSFAMNRGSPHVVQLLLGAGASPHAQSADEEPLLLTAAREAHDVELVQLVQLLLSHVVDIDDPNHQRTTAVMVAAQKGHLATVTVLSDNGADLNIVDDDGTTAMGYACLMGHQAVV